MKLLSEAVQNTSSEMKKHENSHRRQTLNVTNFQPLLAFTAGHILTQLHQFLISSFRDFVQTDATKNNTCSQQLQSSFSTFTRS